MACVSCLLAFSEVAVRSGIFPEKLLPTSAFASQLAGESMPVTLSSLQSMSRVQGIDKPPKGLALSAVQQPQKSGFLQLLPDVLTAASDRLLSVSDTAILVGSTITPQEGRAEAALLPDGSPHIVMLQEHVRDSFDLFESLWEQWPFADAARR
jgi:hypothetical protein